MQCRTCGHEVDCAAKICYNCGRPDPFWVRNPFEGSDIGDVAWMVPLGIVLWIGAMFLAYFLLNVLLPAMSR